jgi:hypothetical protein
MNTLTSGRVRLESSSLGAAAYDERRQTLQLDFRDGTRYLYSGIAPQLYREFLCAGSQGSFFNRYIRTDFPYVRIASKN